MMFNFNGKSVDLEDVRVIIFNSDGLFYDSASNSFVSEKKEYKGSSALLFYYISAHKLDKSTKMVQFVDDSEVYIGDMIKTDLLNGNELRKVQETDSQNP